MNFVNIFLAYYLLCKLAVATASHLYDDHRGLIVKTLVLKISWSVCFKVVCHVCVRHNPTHTNLTNAYFMYGIVTSHANVRHGWKCFQGSKHFSLIARAASIKIYFYKKHLVAIIVILHRCYNRYSKLVNTLPGKEI